MTRMTGGPDCAVMCNLINTHTHTHTQQQVSLIPPWEDECEWHRMTRMIGPDCAVMCNLINTHTHEHTHTTTLIAKLKRSVQIQTTTDSIRILFTVLRLANYCKRLISMFLSYVAILTCLSRSFSARRFF